MSSRPHVVARRHDEMRQERLQRRLRRFCGAALELDQLAFDPVRPDLAEHVDLPPSRRLGARVGQVDDDALVDPVDGGVRLLDEALQPFGQPVVAPRLTALAVHALLDDDPAAVVGDDEAVQIEVEPVLDRGAVDLGDEAARGRELFAVEADPVPDCDELLRRLARMRPAAAADMQAEFARQRPEPPLERADDRGRDAGRVPVHAHHRAEGLEPEGMRETPQEFVAPVFEHDRLGDHGAEPRHALSEPPRHAAAVQRKVCAASAPRHQRTTPGCDLIGRRVWEFTLPAIEDCFSRSTVAAAEPRVSPLGRRRYLAVSKYLMIRARLSHAFWPPNDGRLTLARRHATWSRPGSAPAGREPSWPLRRSSSMNTRTAHGVGLSLEHHRKQRRGSLARLAGDRKRDAGPIPRHRVAARLVSAPSRDPIGLAPKVGQERIRLRPISSRNSRGRCRFDILKSLIRRRTLRGCASQEHDAPGRAVTGVTAPSSPGASPQLRGGKLTAGATLSHDEPAISGNVRAGQSLKMRRPIEFVDASNVVIRELQADAASPANAFLRTARTARVLDPMGASSLSPGPRQPSRPAGYRPCPAPPRRRSRACASKRKRALADPARAPERRQR